MKRFFQVVSVVVVALLAAQPALAGLPCEMGTSASGHSAPCCHKAMHQMAMDCQMPHQIAGTGCAPSCCHDASPQVVAQLASGAKPKAGRTVYFTVAPQTVADAGTALVAAPPGIIVSTPPARYILFQVFRI